MNSPSVSKKTYLMVWGGLLFLLLLTWGMAELNLGPFNTVVAMLIALAKMLLVVLFFMHVRYSTRLIWIFVCGGFFWFAIMIVLTLADYFTRGGFTF